MSNLINHLPLFLLALTIGLLCVVEGFLIVQSRKNLTPLPKKILYRLSVVLIGEKRSQQRFAGPISAKDTHTYAVFALIAGTSLLVSSVIYLVTVL